VQRIFELCAAGQGVKAIAKALNALGAPSPRPQRGRPRSWAPSSVREVLHRDAYRGIVVYNKSVKRNSWGQKRQTARPASEWIHVPAPALQIVSDDLWARAHLRLAAAKAVYLKGTGGASWGRPPSGIASKYLLSGFLSCARCGGSMTVRSTSHGSHRMFSYTCACFDHRGATVCANNVLLPLDAADDAILKKLRDQLLDTEVIEGAIADVLEELRPSRAVDQKQKALEADLQRIEGEQGRYAEAIATAGPLPALLTALQDRERQSVQVRQDLAAIAIRARVSGFNVARIGGALRAKVKDWKHQLRQRPQIARQMIAQLLDGKIAWTPTKDNRAYAFRGRVTYDGLLSGLVPLPQGMASPTGFEPVFWP
jgi:site-specific DNA recombinase